MVNTSAPGTSNDVASNTVEQDANRVRETAQHDWDETKRRAREDLEEVKREARHEFDNAREATGQFAEGQKNHAADQLESLANAFGRVGDDLRDDEQAWVGRYAGDIADRLGGFANHARSSTVDDLVGDVERFGRQQPTAFLTGAALLGFAATRFFSASANRRSRNASSRHYRSPSSVVDDELGSTPQSGRSRSASSETPGVTHSTGSPATNRDHGDQS